MTIPIVKAKFFKGSIACVCRSCLEQRCWDVPEAKKKKKKTFRVKPLLEPQGSLISSLFSGIGVWGASGEEQGPVEECNLGACLPSTLFVSPHRTMTSPEPVLSNLTEGYCAALIPPLIILKPVKL